VGQIPAALPADYVYFSPRLQEHHITLNITLISSVELITFLLSLGKRKEVYSSKGSPCALSSLAAWRGVGMSLTQ
jgi:hypothetical protein